MSIIRLIIKYNDIHFSDYIITANNMNIGISTKWKVLKLSAFKQFIQICVEEIMCRGTCHVWHILRFNSSKQRYTPYSCAFGIQPPTWAATKNVRPCSSLWMCFQLKFTARNDHLLLFSQPENPIWVVVNVNENIHFVRFHHFCCCCCFFRSARFRNLWRK